MKSTQSYWLFLAAANVKFIRERKSAFLWKQENAGEKKYLINQNESYTETEHGIKSFMFSVVIHKL